jgi:UDP-N-acetylmuramate--alanine ligase
VHNVQNATAALAMAMTLGVTFETAAAALGRFAGVARRFDFRGRFRGITLVDDYAHLPTEIAASIEAARTGGDGWSRIVAVFQPNRFRRMAVLSPDYRDAFVGADLTVITDIYASGDAPIPGVTGKLVVDAVLDSHPHQRVAWMPRRSDLVDFLARELRPGDVCISMGCGDIASLPDELMARVGIDSDAAHEEAS